ncbi:hypothetical protein [Halocatena marina]|uniref:Uncharacterized protein n=1 Tax=Halocatena marina TaxID=2934937 RepID=A0ABD5YVB2_9EURY|nr:hypothetical protein [Halocatena marina]
MIVELPDVWNPFVSLASEGVVIIDNISTTLCGFVVCLEECEPFTVQPASVPVILGEELVQGSFDFRWKNVY